MNIEELNNLIQEYEKRHDIYPNDVHVRIYGSGDFILVHLLGGGKASRVYIKNIEELIDRLKNN